MLVLLLATLLVATMPSKPKIPRKFIPMLEAAEWLGVSGDTVRRRIADGTLRGHRLPGSRLIFVNVSEVEALIEKSKIPTAGVATDGRTSA